MSDEKNEPKLSAAVTEALADEAIWVEPPPEVETSVLSGIAAEAEGVESARSTRDRPLIPALVVTAALVAFVVAFAAGVFEQAPPAEVRAVLAGSELTPDVEGTAVAQPTANGWLIRLDVAGLDPAEEGTFYEGWVWSGDDAVSIGTFHMRGGDGYVVLWSGVGLEEYGTVWVTLQEQRGGHAPSDRLVLSGTFD